VSLHIVSYQQIPWTPTERPTGNSMDADRTFLIEVEDA